MKTRFAPSPTGPFHIGSMRTALLVQALAQSKQGEAILRIEDTDLQRSKKEYEDEIFLSLDWAGIPFPQPITRQSERLGVYDEVIAELINLGLAYPCYMTMEELNYHRESIRVHNKDNPGDYKEVKYDNRFRPENFPNGIPQSIKDLNPNPVIRLKMPNDGETTWKDGGKGEITISNSKLDDIIIKRSDGAPTYNFVVVVDDMDMGVTDVIRGEDHINNTPKQIQIHKILKQLPRYTNSPRINYAHLPLMLNPDGTKISKSALEEKGDNSKVPAQISSYREMGILPEALINYLFLISSQKTAQKCGGEMFTMEQFVQKFKSSDLSTSSARFDMNKLYNLNFKYINKLTDDEFKERIINFSPETPIDSLNFNALAGDLKKRSKTIVEAIGHIEQLIKIKDFLAVNLKSLTGFAQIGLSAKSEEDLKEIFSQEAAVTGESVADISKRFRVESHLDTPLPFFSAISAIRETPKPKIKIN